MGLKSQILITKNTQKFRAPTALQLAAVDITLKLKFIRNTLTVPRHGIHWEAPQAIFLGYYMKKNSISSVKTIMESQN